LVSSQSQLIKQTSTKLTSVNTTSKQAIVGFDGFVDEIIDVVDKRITAGPSGYTKVETISAFGNRIANAAGFSTNIELVPRTVKLGGNGPIMANALQALGLGITYIGALGQPALHPVFAELASKARIISIAQPAHTDALEFADGKIMLGKMNTLMDVTWENLLAAIPLANLQQLCAKCSLLAATNWTMLPYATQLWQGILEHMLPNQGADSLIAFFDLADPEKRSPADLLEALHTIKAYNDRCGAVLGCNRKEAAQIAQVLQLDMGNNNHQVPLEQITKTLADTLDFYGVVVHATKEAACVIDNEFALVNGPYTPQPKLTTGAGDNFNAGFCLGLICGLSPAETLIAGVANSGFYVRNARSATHNELLEFMELWQQRETEV